MRALFRGILLAAAAVSSSAANFSGKWALQNSVGRGGGGRGGTTVLTLTQAGNTVTGTITVRVDPGTNSPLYADIWGGKFEGDSLSFYIWTGTDQPSKIIYSGKMSASGDEIAFTLTASGSGPESAGGGPGRGQTRQQQITATRTK